MSLVVILAHIMFPYLHALVESEYPGLQPEGLPRDYMRLLPLANHYSCRPLLLNVIRD